MDLRRGAARGSSTPIFFLARQKENGRGRSKEKALGTNRRGACSYVRGSCGSVRRGSLAPSSLRLTPVLEESCTRITTAADDRGARSYLPLLLSPRVTRWPGGILHLIHISRSSRLPPGGKLTRAARLMRGRATQIGWQAAPHPSGLRPATFPQGEGFWVQRSPEQRAEPPSAPLRTRRPPASAPAARSGCAALDGFRKCPGSA